VEKEKILTEHLRARTGHTRSLCIIGVAVFCDRSLFSQPLDSDGLVSIEVLGYVQANNTTPPLSTMLKWIESATWKPVEGGLTSDNENMSNMRRLQDPNDEWTRLMLFRSIGANNVGRSEEKDAKRQALDISQISTNLLPRVLLPIHHQAGARLPPPQVRAYFSRIRRERLHRRNCAEINR
jgi:hypothetical protein